MFHKNFGHNSVETIDVDVSVGLGIFHFSKNLLKFTFAGTKACRWVGFSIFMIC